MRIRCIGLIALLTLVMTNCTPADSSAHGKPVDRSESRAEDENSNMPLNTKEITSEIQTPVATSLPTQEDETMPPQTTTEEGSQKLVELAKEHLSQTSGIPVNEILLTGVQSVLWPDGSLGCPKPNVDYIAMETPGYILLLSAGGKTYSYHTNQTNRFVLCGR